MQRRDRVRDLVLRILGSANAPLETTEIVDLVRHAIPDCTRTIVFKRLTDLRGDGRISGKYLGSGKGVWIWWRKNSFSRACPVPSIRDTVSGLILDVLFDAGAPFETREVVELVQRAIPDCTRTIIFRRLNLLRGDAALRGKFVGSGKGVWIWWRNNAFEA